MTTLRNRLLVTLVLAAVITSALGTGVASARSLRRGGSASSNTAVVTRPGVGRFGGEPNPDGSGAPCPPQVSKTSLQRVSSNPGLWMLQLWIQMRARSPFAQQLTSGR